MDRVRINHSQDLIGLNREFSKVATFFKTRAKSLVARFNDYVAVKEFLSTSWWYVCENVGDLIKDQKFSDIMKNFYEQSQISNSLEIEWFTISCNQRWKLFSY